MKYVLIVMTLLAATAPAAYAAQQFCYTTPQGQYICCYNWYGSDWQCH